MTRALKRSNAAEDLVGAQALARAVPVAALRTVHESHPTYPGLSAGIDYPAWVLTLANLPYDQSAAAALGGPPGSQPVDTSSWRSCAVAIYDLRLKAFTRMWEGPCA